MRPAPSGGYQREKVLVINRGRENGGVVPELWSGRKEEPLSPRTTSLSKLTVTVL